MAHDLDVPLIPSIRTDAEVAKAARAKLFLADYEPKSKALEDYDKAAEKILKILRSESMNEVNNQEFGRLAWRLSIGDREPRAFNSWPS